MNWKVHERRKRGEHQSKAGGKGKQGSTHTSAKGARRNIDAIRFCKKKWDRECQKTKRALAQESGREGNNRGRGKKYKGSRRAG